MKSQRGFSLIEILIAMTIVMLATYAFLIRQPGGVDAVKKQSLNINASGYATELMEFFRSMNGARFKTYLSTNPMNGTPVGYPLCAHIGILDRAQVKIINEDPLTRLPAAALGGLGDARQANRWFLVEVVDPATLKAAPPPPLPALPACGRPVNNYTLRKKAAGDPVDEVYYVTVGVTWFAGLNDPMNEVQRISIGTTIPD